ncbi:hypothetical protein E2986_11705 [Frieseomelitta varia]|uniref:Odorant receptor n=1 Tax=Frieseomelitta varia TaxID=561572 RepID=A0A833RW10_9HYME|nr:hypothetical protein E2986_11705 [Frieseomelitta varia]
MRASAASVLDSETCNNVDSQVSSSVLNTTQKMTRVQNAEDGINHIFRVVHPLLNVLSAWPTNVRPSVLSKIRKWFTIFFVYLIQFVVIVPSILYIILKAKSTRSRIKLLVPQCNTFSQLFKYTIVLRRHDEIRELLDDLRNDWFRGTEEDQRIYETRATIGQRLVISFMIFLYTGGTSLRTITPFLREKVVLPDNTTIRPLPCPGYFVLFNEQLTPNYEIIFFIQVFSGFLSYTEVSGILGLCATLCLHMCSMLKILGNKMRELSSLSETDEETVQKKITDIVEYQTKIKRCVFLFKQ